MTLAKPAPTAQGGAAQRDGESLARDGRGREGEGDHHLGREHNQHSEARHQGHLGQDAARQVVGQHPALGDHRCCGQDAPPRACIGEDDLSQLAGTNGSCNVPVAKEDFRRLSGGSLLAGGGAGAGQSGSANDPPAVRKSIGVRLALTHAVLASFFAAHNYKADDLQNR